MDNYLIFYTVLAIYSLIHLSNLNWVGSIEFNHSKPLENRHTNSDSSWFMWSFIFRGFNLLNLKSVVPNQRTPTYIHNRISLHIPCASFIRKRLYLIIHDAILMKNRVGWFQIIRIRMDIFQIFSTIQLTMLKI